MKVLILNYQVAEIFNTISGEIPTTGQQATFIRLFGCPVGCRFCDTLYTVPWDKSGYKLGYLKGALKGDGHLGSANKDATRSFWFQVKDKEFVDTFVQFFEEVFGKEFARSVKIHYAGGHKTGWPKSQIYEVRCGIQKIVKSLQEMPATEEQWRGFAAGFFDAEGSCSEHQIGYSNQDLFLLESLQAFLAQWQIPFRITKPDKDGTYALMLRATFDKQNLTNLVKGQKYHYNKQRFFDFVRPRLSRKYIGVKKRWVPHIMNEIQIIEHCTHKLIVLTGGSPTLQKLDSLIQNLQKKSHVVQLETEGTYPLGERIPDIVVCSPKARMGYKIHPELIQHINFLKYVVDSDFTEDAVLKGTKIPIYLMPEGYPPKQENIKQVLNYLAAHPNWSFGPRLHTWIGVE